ncbi:MAG: response regulator [Candidatus Acidiferrales bacterium]
MTLHWQIVVASADMEDRRALTNILAEQGIEPIITPTVRGCMEILSKENVQMVFCDRTLADGTYRDLLNAVRAQALRTKVVVTSRVADWDEFLEATRLGAFDVITSPCRPTDVDWMIIQAQRDQTILAEKNRSPAAHGSQINFRHASAGKSA